MDVLPGFSLPWMSQNFSHLLSTQGPRDPRGICSLFREMCVVGGKVFKPGARQTRWFLNPMSCSLGFCVCVWQVVYNCMYACVHMYAPDSVSAIVHGC